MAWAKGLIRLGAIATSSFQNQVSLLYFEASRYFYLTLDMTFYAYRFTTFLAMEVGMLIMVLMLTAFLHTQGILGAVAFVDSLMD